MFGSLWLLLKTSDAADPCDPWCQVAESTAVDCAQAALQRLVADRRLRRCTRLQTQVREDLLDDRLFQDRRNDLQRAAAAQAVFHVNLEHALEQLGPTRQLSYSRPAAQRCPLLAGSRCSLRSPQADFAPQGDRTNIRSAIAARGSLRPRIAIRIHPRQRALSRGSCRALRWQQGRQLRHSVQILFERRIDLTRATLSR